MKNIFKKLILSIFLLSPLFSWHYELIPNGSYEFWMWDSDTLPVGHYWYHDGNDHNPPLKYSHEKIDGNYSAALVPRTHGLSRTAVRCGMFPDTLYLSFYAKRKYGSHTLYLEYGGFPVNGCTTGGLVNPPAYRFYDFDNQEWRFFPGDPYGYKALSLPSDGQWHKFEFIVYPDTYLFQIRSLALTVVGAGNGSDTILIDSLSLHTKEYDSFMVPDTFGYLHSPKVADAKSTDPPHWPWEDNPYRAMIDTLYWYSLANNWQVYFHIENPPNYLYYVHGGWPDWPRSYDEGEKCVSFDWTIYDSLTNLLRTRWPLHKLILSWLTSPWDTTLTGIKFKYICHDLPTPWLNDLLVDQYMRYFYQKNYNPIAIMIQNEDMPFAYCWGQCNDYRDIWKRNWISAVSIAKSYFPEALYTEQGTHSSIELIDSIFSFLDQANVPKNQRTFSWHTGMATWMVGWGSLHHVDTLRNIAFGTAFDGHYAHYQPSYSKALYLIKNRHDTIPIIYDEVNIYYVSWYPDSFGVDGYGGMHIVIANQIVHNAFMNSPWLLCFGMNDPTGQKNSGPLMYVQDYTYTQSYYTMKLLLKTNLPGSRIIDYSQDNLHGYHYISWTKNNKTNFLIINMTPDTKTIPSPRTGQYYLSYLKLKRNYKEDTLVTITNNITLEPFEIQLYEEH